MSDWVLYGATGYTGVLLAEEAAQRGHKPLLSGRNPEKLRALGTRLGLEWRAVGLEDPGALRGLLEGKAAVLHAAGPFVQTCQPMVEACLAVGCSYLDITGELPVFEALFARDAEAKARKIALIPGVGFDVVPSDCLAAYVAAKLPGAQRLDLALAMLGQPTAGTMKSILGLVSVGGKVRRDGVLVSAPIGRGVHPVRFNGRRSWVVPAPVADLITAWHSTGIPNITVSMAVSAGFAQTLKFGWPLGVVGMPLVAGALRAGPIRKRLEASIERKNTGPDAHGLENNHCYVHARASDSTGKFVEAWLETADGYRFTGKSGVSAVEQVLAKRPIGALAPSQAFGVDFVLDVAGSKRFDALPPE